MPGPTQGRYGRRSLEGLAALAGGGGGLGGPGPRPPAADDLFGAMNPSLRRHLANAYGADMLDDLSPSFGEMPDYFDPSGGATMSPVRIDPDERRFMRGQQMAWSEAEQGERFEDQYAPWAAHRAADVADIEAQRGARRYYDPLVHAANADEFQRKLRLQTMPSMLAASSRENVAQTQAGARLGAAQMGRPGQTEVLGKFLNDLSDAGAFGFDRSGRPLPPPDELRDPSLDILRRMLAPGATAGPGGQQGPAPGAGGMGGGRGGGPGAGMPIGGDLAQWEPMIQRALSQGLFPTREAAIADLQARGYLR